MKKESIEHAIGMIDHIINEQVNQILHHPDFQQLESSWRGLMMLINCASEGQHVIIRMLNVSLNLLSKDLNQAIEFDQSQIFKKVYTEEFDQPGGTPYGLLIGDYYFSHKSTVDSHDNIRTLSLLAKIASASFSPFISGTDSNLFGLDSYEELSPNLNISQLLKQEEYTRWQKLRQDEDTRFIGLTLPRILMRNTYNQNGVKLRHRNFKEIVHSNKDILWGNPAYAYACTVIQCFQETGWFTDIRGVNSSTRTGGTTHLARHYYSTDAKPLLAAPSTEVLITDNQEKRLSDIGVMALSDEPLSEKSIFYSSQSMHITKSYTTTAGTINSQLSSMLHYILSSCRFAHYIKIIMRDKVGSFMSANECERYIKNWINKYCAASENMTETSRAKYPLNEAKIKIEQNPGNPGLYQCTMHLKPHDQLDNIQSHLTFVTKIKKH